MKIRYSELFASFQGEAEFTGMPSMWLRFFGCNLTCDGFGQDDPCNPATYDLPYKTIEIKKYATMADLPVLTKGCDSGYSWSSRFKSLAFDSNEQELAVQILRIMDEKLGVTNWKHRILGTQPQMCFTGGEPMMQQKAMAAILREMENITNEVCPQITIETNATKPIDKASFEEIRDRAKHIHFAMSPKLFSVSGEKDAVKQRIIEDYIELADTATIKFVHNGTRKAWIELAELEEWLSTLPDHVTFWIMPVGATKESQETQTTAEIVHESILRGYRVSARVHAHLLGNGMGV
jgi:organic radical activating enzyme